MSDGDLTASRRVAMAAMSWIPFLHIGGCIAILFAPMGWPARIATAVLVLFLAPPIVARLVALEEGVCRASDRMFLRWWFTTQLQMIFNRLPLEDVLRLVPGLYSLWLRLWGSKVGKFVFWGPRMLILDRSLVRIGDQAVFGAGVRLVSHMLTRSDAGEIELLIAPVRIGDGAIVGAWSLCGPGVDIGDRASVPSAIPLPPHSQWEGEKRVRRSKAITL